MSFSRLFFDLETSYDLVASWRIGYKLNLYPENIIRERAIICIAWKWEGKDNVRSVAWDNGCDKGLLQKFLKVATLADELVAHNGDKFDLKWLRTRAVLHDLPPFPQYTSVDTLKWARKFFNFNSNKLDYIAKFFGFEGKQRHDGIELWKRVIEEKDPAALAEMVSYCKQDIRTLAAVHGRVARHCEGSTHVGVAMGGPRWSCPHCGSENIHKHSNRVTKAGMKRYQYECQDCGHWYRVSQVVEDLRPKRRWPGANQYTT